MRALLLAALLLADPAHAALTSQLENDRERETMIPFDIKEGSAYLDKLLERCPDEVCSYIVRSAIQERLGIIVDCAREVYRRTYVEVPQCISDIERFDQEFMKKYEETK